jgi:hypothetical protein
MSARQGAQQPGQVKNGLPHGGSHLPRTQLCPGPQLVHDSPGSVQKNGAISQCEPLQQPGQFVASQTWDWHVPLTHWPAPPAQNSWVGSGTQPLAGSHNWHSRQLDSSQMAMQVPLMQLTPGEHATSHEPQ